MKIPGNGTPSSPALAGLLRRRKQYRLRRRAYLSPPEGLDGAPPALIERLQALEREKTDWAHKAEQLQDLAARARADFDNFRKRVAREREEMRTNLLAELLFSFLSPLDHLDLALRAVDGSSDPQAVAEGVKMIHRELVSVMESLGAQRIEAVGVAFDPTIHDAVATGADPSQPPQTVLETLRPGWRLGEKCLRAAMVKVNCAESATPAAPADETGELEE